jgi:membrane associated rhomboid family serine protease
VARFFRIKGLLKAQGPLLALIAGISFVFILQSIFGRGAYFGFMAVPSEVVEAWNSLRAGNFSAASAAEIGTLLSCALLHGGADHLMGNMLFLWIFAALAAELLGHRWMLVVFVVTAVCGSLCHVALNADESIPMLGASGAVMGFEGLYLGMAVRWHLPDPHIWPMARSIPPGQLAMLGILGLGMDFMGFMGGSLGVAYGAHLGGFIGGMVMGGAVVPKPFMAGRRR